MKIGAAMAAAAFVFTGCNCTKNIMKMSSGITAEANPAMLVMKDGSVPADVRVKFAPKTFEKSAVVKITPALTFNGGEILGDAQYVQGEKVKDNYTVIGNAGGGEKKFRVSFPYDERAQICNMELRIDGKCKKSPSFVAITKLPVAKGIVAPQNYANFSTALKLLPDNFKKSNTASQSAQIMYEINKSNVRSEQLNSKELKILEDFVKQYSADANASLGTIQSKGYASPEGPAKLNDDLSKKRSESAMNAVSKNFGNSKFDLSPYGEDWEGFQKLVQESDMKDKELVLQVLRMYTSSTERDQALRNMSAVFQVLATDILPKLRRTTLVASVDVKSKSDSELLQIARENPSNLAAEEALYIAPKIDNVQDRIKVYQAAANKYGDARAWNNLAVEQAKAGSIKEAAASLKTALQKGSDPAIGENMGMIALAGGDKKTAGEILSKLSSPEAKAAFAFASGDYAAASKGLTGYNLAVAQLCNGNVAAAKSTLASVTPTGDSEYLKAVIASREGDAKNAIAGLRSAIQKDPALIGKAKKDAEFSALSDSPEFKALLR